MSRLNRREVRCTCGQVIWVEADDHRLPDGPFACGSCDLDKWSNLAAYTGPAEMIFAEDANGSTLLELLDTLGSEVVRIIVYRRKRTPNEVN